MTDKQTLLRQLPKVDTLLSDEEIAGNIRLLGHRQVTDVCRNAVTTAKARAIELYEPPVLRDIVSDILEACRHLRSKMLGRVINGTGVLLHTNLGRAPLGDIFFEELREVASGYCNIEIDVLDRRRGGRGPGVTSLLKQVCDAEDAVVVNNNAAALFVLLSTFAVDREVVVSRGELIQIGGGFRIPDILKNAGATLREIGTTNITTVADYENAICDETAMVLKVHKANFHMDGFVESPDIKALKQAGLQDVILASDLGSGNLVRKEGDLIVREPTPKDMLKAGADLVCFSCDKMLGGVQGGVIAGRSDLIAKIKKHPVMRVVRVDKLTYAALQIILRHHLNGEHGKVLLYDLASKSKEALTDRVKHFLEAHGLNPENFKTVPTVSTFGGGSTPALEIPSAGIGIVSDRGPDGVAQQLQQFEPPIIGTVKGDLFIIDFRTILKTDESHLAKSLKQI